MFDIMYLGNDWLCLLPLFISLVPARCLKARKSKDESIGIAVGKKVANGDQELVLGGVGAKMGINKLRRHRCVLLTCRIDPGSI
jgi:hypothetical protein